MSEVELLTAEEVAAMRRDLDLFPYVMDDGRERIVATLEALIRERDELRDDVRLCLQSLNEAIDGGGSVDSWDITLEFREAMCKEFEVECQPR